MAIYHGQHGIVRMPECEKKKCAGATCFQRAFMFQCTASEGLISHVLFFFFFSSLDTVTLHSPFLPPPFLFETALLLSCLLHSRLWGSLMDFTFYTPTASLFDIATQFSSLHFCCCCYLLETSCDICTQISLNKGMSIIYVDQLAVRLPSDARNAFNPSYAFCGASGRSIGQVMGLREAQSGHILLPMDAEGTIVVTPGQHYNVVIVREAKPASMSAANDSGAASATGNSGEASRKNKNQSSGKPQQQKDQKQSAKEPEQQQQKQPSPVRDPIPDTRPKHVPSQPEQHQQQQQQSQKQQKDRPSKQERKAAHAAAAAEPQQVAEAQPVENAPQVSVAATAVIESEQPGKKKRRHEAEAPETVSPLPSSSASTSQKKQQPQVDAEPPQSHHRHAHPATASPAPEEEDSNDVPLMQVYTTTQPSQPIPDLPQTTAPAKDRGNSSKRGSKGGSPNAKPQAAVAPPLPPVLPPTAVRRARSPSSSSSDGDSTPFSQLYGAPVPTPAAAAAAAEEEDTAARVKRRRAPAEKKPAKTAGRAQSSQEQQQQHATATAAATPKHSPMQHHLAHQESPETVPVTLPPSGRGSLVRRMPLDSSSDSDSD